MKIRTNWKCLAKFCCHQYSFVLIKFLKLNRFNFSPKIKQFQNRYQRPSCRWYAYVHKTASIELCIKIFMGKNLINEALTSCFPGKSIVNFLDKYSSVEMHFLKLQNATLWFGWVHMRRYIFLLIQDLILSVHFTGHLLKSKSINLEFSRIFLLLLNVYSMTFFQGTVFPRNKKIYQWLLLNRFGPLFRFEFTIWIQILNRL